MDRRNRFVVPAVLAIALVSVAGCKKKVAPPPPPPPPPPPAAPAPTAHISGNPIVITAGGSLVLNWSTTNATSASIDGIGEVPTAGTRNVSPPSSTVYHLVARGAGGTASDSVRITVNPPPPVAAAPVNNLSAEQEFRNNVSDIFFDYDKSNIRPDAQSTLALDATYLTSHPAIKILIGGYCDERGSEEYNVALGENRAEAAKTALVNAGINASRIRVISYGKEKPFCTESNEDCWQKNRRAGFSLDH